MNSNLYSKCELFICFMEFIYNYNYNYISFDICKSKITAFFNGKTKGNERNKNNLKKKFLNTNNKTKMLYICIYFYIIQIILNEHNFLFNIFKFMMYHYC